MSEVVHVRLPFPHPGQRRVRRECSRFNVLSAGRRWRKTTLGVPIVTEALFTVGGSYLWTAPTYDQTLIAWRELQRAAGDVLSFNNSKLNAATPDGRGTVFFRSLDNPDNARGFTAHGIIMDESADVAASAWYEVLRPMLMDTRGWAWLMGTPKGRNWFWREWVRATDADHPDPEWSGWQIPTLGCRITPDGLERVPHDYENPDIPFSELRSLYERMPENVFRQEILAEFVEDAGGVFRGVSACATGVLLPGAASLGPGTYVMGVDWGQQNDFTVLVVMDAKRKTVVDFDRFNGVGWELQKGRLRAMWEKWTVPGQTWCSVLAEENSIGGPLIDALRRDGLPVYPFTTTAATKTQIIESLSLAIERRLVSYPDLPALVNELQAYQSERTASGLRRFSAPEGMHDDAVIALSLAYHAATTGVALPVSRGEYAFGSVQTEGLSAL